jgi:hypothetical protein
MERNLPSHRYLVILVLIGSVLMVGLAFFSILIGGR